MQSKKRGDLPPRPIAAALEWQSRNQFPAAARATLGSVFMGRWLPSEEELRSCCRKLNVSRYNEYGTNVIFRHVLSQAHVARKFRVSNERFQQALTVIRVLDILES